MSPDPRADLARLRTLAFAFPRTAEKLSHGMPVFFIDKGRTFAWYMHDHHGDGRSAVLAKTSGPDEQDMLIARDAALFYRPPYLGPAGWIAIRTDMGSADWDLIAARVDQSWRLVAPRRLAEALA